MTREQQLLTIAEELEDRAKQLRALAADVATPPADVATPPADVATPPADVAIPAPARPVETADFFTDYGRVYDFLRGNKMLGPVISPSEFQGCDSIIKAFALNGSPLSHLAYGLATTYHETAHTMQPIPERGGNAYFHRMYDIEGARPRKARELGNTQRGDGVRFKGRGYVQLTGRANYARATANLRKRGHDVDLVANPDLALRHDLAAIILVDGMTEGWFTTRRFSHMLPNSGPATVGQFVAARPIINGTDRARMIADYAMDFQKALQAGAYQPR